MDSQTIILSGLVSSILSLIVSLIVTRYRFYRLSQKKEKEEIENWKKDIRKHLRKNAKKDKQLHNLNSFDKLDESIEKYESRLNEAPYSVDTDLEMKLAKVEFLWYNMNFWEVYDEEEIRDEFWFEVDKAKKEIEEDLRSR